MDDTVVKTEQQWREELSPAQYRVLREAGTEPPFTGKYFDCHDDGMYHCAACGAELFSSRTKFDSGTGWPSFTEPAVAAAIDLHTDRSFGMARTEVRCRR
ncbi:MAG: peptide-methionine (R)-S-oxide reductase MsrB, partial [Actinomycetota bacterium]